MNNCSTWTMNATNNQHQQQIENENKTNNNQPLSGNSTHRWHASSTSINIHNHQRQANATLEGQNIIWQFLCWFTYTRFVCRNWDMINLSLKRTLQSNIVMCNSPQIVMIYAITWFRIRLTWCCFTYTCFVRRNWYMINLSLKRTLQSNIVMRNSPQIVMIYASGLGLD